MTVDEVVQLAREFIAGLPAENYRGLPDYCVPRQVHDSEDVGRLAFDLTRCSIEAGPAEPKSIPFMLAFFSRAAARIAEIAGRAHLPGLGAASHGAGSR